MRYFTFVGCLVEKGINPSRGSTYLTIHDKTGDRERNRLQICSDNNDYRHH